MSDPVIVDIVAQLRAERIRQGLTQYALAELVDMDQSTICQIENNRYQSSLPVLRRVAQGLGMRVNVTLERKL